MERTMPPISVIRQKVLAAFHELGAGDGDCSEVVLINDGHFVGRRFCLSGFEGVWLAGESHLSIINEAGELIDTLPLERADVPAEESSVNEMASTDIPCSYRSPSIRA